MRRRGRRKLDVMSILPQCLLEELAYRVESGDWKEQLRRFEREIASYLHGVQVSQFSDIEVAVSALLPELIARTGVQPNRFPLYGATVGLRPTTHRPD